MKIFLNRKPVEGPWGGGNLMVKSLCHFLPQYGHEVVHHLSGDIDLIFMQDPRYSDLGVSINEIIAYKKTFPRTKIIHRVNECDARKDTNEMDDLLRYCSANTDVTVFVSDWIKEYHVSKGWLCNNVHVIHNGVNTSDYKSGNKIMNSKTNIVTHHWSNNRMKGFDTYEMLDQFVGDNPEFTFNYIGRELGTFTNTNVISPIHGDALANELARYDVYISGSLFDPGPNHVLEALACELPTYVIRDGGGAVEFAGNDHTFQTHEELLEILLKKDFKKNEYKPHDWHACVKKYNMLLNIA